MSIILYSDDINLLAHWEKVPFGEYKVVDDLNDLKAFKSSIIIINFSAFNHTYKELIPFLQKKENSVLVLHRTPNIQTAKEVLLLGAKGYGNALMREHFIVSAVETLKDGMVWLHPEFTSQLILQVPEVKKDISEFLQQLSDREKEVTLLLKDAHTYKVIADKLDITPRTVKAHAHSIYTKLGVKDRLALALLLK